MIPVWDLRYGERESHSEDHGEDELCPIDACEVLETIKIEEVVEQGAGVIHAACETG